MSDLSLKRFLRVGLCVAGLFWLALGLFFAARGGAGWEDFFGIAVAGALVGFLASSCRYLVLLAREIQQLHLPVEKLEEGEEVLLETLHSMVHYRTGRPSRFWEAVGGKLYLTNQRLVFLAHRGQPWHYELSLALDAIVQAETCLILDHIPGGLRVLTAAGEEELFTFGAVHELEADRFAAGILLARYRAYPDWTPERGTLPSQED